jgi:CRISPR/Cas system CMR-associated protein Cmr1 (group 7 of RAMP superfamily)
MFFSFSFSFLRAVSSLVQAKEELFSFSKRKRGIERLKVVRLSAGEETTFIITLDSIDFFVTKRILTAVGEHRILLGAPAKGLGAIRNLLYKM